MTDQVTSASPSKSVIPDFSGARNFKEIQRRFIQAAESIMLDHDLEYEEDGSKWKITALELYLKLSDGQDIWDDPIYPFWRDPTCHGAHEQLQSGRWYIHQRGQNWRAPGYCGIDITAGSEINKTHAGLLIRELNRNDGSAKAFHTIMRGESKFRRDGWNGAERDLIKRINGKCVFAGPLRLSRRQTREQKALWIGPRIFSSKTKPSAPYADCCLRVATWETKKRNDMKEIPLRGT